MGLGGYITLSIEQPQDRFRRFGVPFERVRPRTRKALLFTALAGLLGFAVYDEARERGAASNAERRTTSRPSQHFVAERPTRSETAVVTTASNSGALTLPERAPFGEMQGKLFFAPPPPPVAAPITAAAAPPAPPPLPYKFAGTLAAEPGQQVLLSKGDSVFAVKVGDTLDGLYRVDAINELEILLNYLPLKLQQAITVTSSIAVAGPAVSPEPKTVEATVAPQASLQAGSGDSERAKLAWDGPQEVRMGAAFHVAIKIRTNEPLQGSPMQIRFDPDVLQAVAVQPGNFFAAADRQFNYRINPDGTIFVGASGAKPASAANAELLVLTFKPLRPAAEAQLAVASLNLVGVQGRSIGFEHLGDYRATIVR